MALGSWSLAVLLFQALEALGLRYAWLPLGILIFEVALSVNIKTYPSSESSCGAPVPVQQVRVASITGSGSLLHEGFPFTLHLSIQPVQRRAGFFCFPSKRRGWIVLWPWLVGDTSQVRNYSSAMDFLGFRMFIWGFPLFSCFCEISWFSLLFESFIFFSFFGVWSHSEMLSYSFRWLLPCICPWLLFLFLKHGCFPRCRPLPGPLLWHFSRDLHCSHVNYYLLP